MNVAREFEFTLVLTGIPEVTDDVADALYTRCDDATLSVRYGRPYLTFCRPASSLTEAILTAIQDIRKANIGADVLRVDVCDLVTQADVARRIDRSRQLVHQYIKGIRGPGGFPPPACHLSDEAPLWNWCEVAFWLREHDLINEEQFMEAKQLAVINSVLELARIQHLAPELTAEAFKLIMSGNACCL